MNYFTENFVNNFYDRATATGKANKGKVFTKPQVHKYFSTIQALNHTGTSTGIIKGDQLTAGYEIPAFLKDLVVPDVTLSGSYGEVPLLTFQPVEDKDIMSAYEFNTFGRTMYSLFRKDFDMESVLDILSKPEPIGNYASRITDVHGKYVGIVFEQGEYPLTPKCEFLLPEAMGMSTSVAEDLWIEKKLDDLARK